MNSTAVLDNNTSFRSIGRSSWLNYWIVDPGDHDRLMPVGGIGELLLEGYSIAQGYLGEPGKTAAAFIQAPAWAMSMRAGLDGRKWYKTGDLVQYQHNGDIHLYGRKDSQLKVNGQRVEAADIESQIANAFREEFEQVVVDQVGVEQSRKLAAFITLKACEENRTVEDIRSEVHTRLKPLVPAWMIPSHIVLLSAMPRTATGKLDRRTLKQRCEDDLGESQRLEQPDDKSECETQIPESDHAVANLISLCNQVLRIEENDVSSQSNWTMLRGDSLNAMKFVKDARDSGVYLTTTDLMMGQTLAELCASGSDASAIQNIDDGPLQPLQKTLPLTDFQAHYLAPGSGSERGLLYKYRITFRGHFDVSKIQEAIYLWFDKLEALRLSFSRDTAGQPVQSVIDPDQATWRSRVILEGQNQSAGDPAAQNDFFTNPILVVLHGSDQTTPSEISMSLYINHCIFDGTSANHMFRDLAACYTASSVSLRPSFLRYLDHRLLQRHESSLLYWGNLLKGSRKTLLRSDMKDSQNDKSELAIRTISCVSSLTSRKRTNASTSTLVYAAWSLVLSVISGRSDVVFLYLVHGRDEEVAGSDAIVGCCVSEVPCRVKFSDSMSLEEVTHFVQAQIWASIPHVHLGSKTIATRCTDWLDEHRGYDHSSLIVHQNVPIETNLAVGDHGYMNIQQAEPEQRMTNDFDLLTTSSSANELSFTIKCLKRLYNDEELHAVAEAFSLAVKMMLQGEQRGSDVLERIRKIQSLPIVAA
ncbi:hypothetical protein CBER1_11496 [Cercospora berteroae]|uniref:Carrier domain-containing protein n=1 Tax=Cercospora berteroae TaxID=357750 RepID=A0A2S6BZY1_9PEZI|nr:hypothetical protein CBER1_11496 [Cercospora berteroae]